MRLDPDHIYEKLVKLGEEWADAQGAAEILEETKKTTLAQLATESNETSVAARDNYALRHEDYKVHLKTMVSARKTANKAKVRYDSAKIWAELKRTEAANERATIRSAP